jgi:hypothetical protein
MPIPAWTKEGHWLNLCGVIERLHCMRACCD